MTQDITRTVSVPTESRPTELARQVKIHAAMIVQRVAELPDYNSPEDRPNEMTCTDSELMYIAETQLEAFAEQVAASSSLLPVGRPCSACQGNHFDHTFVHFSLSNDLGGFCWEGDHYPNEGDILVSSNISEVTCPKCREYCQTLNDLKKLEGFSEDDIRRDDLPRDTFELIHDLAYDHEGRDRWQYRTRAQQILKSNGLPVCRQLECGQNSVLDADLVGCGKAIKEAEIFRCVDCGVPFHRECARKHFIAGESVLTAAMVDEQSRRDNSLEGLRIVCSARDYLNEQIPKDWTATELLNSLWGTFMKEQSGWKKLASLPVGESHWMEETTRQKKNALIRQADALLHIVMDKELGLEEARRIAADAHAAIHALAGILSDDPEIRKVAANEGLGESREPGKSTLIGSTIYNTKERTVRFEHAVPSVPAEIESRELKLTGRAGYLQARHQAVIDICDTLNRPMITGPECVKMYDALDKFADSTSTQEKP